MQDWKRRPDCGRFAQNVVVQPRSASDGFVRRATLDVANRSGHSGSNRAEKASALVRVGCKRKEPSQLGQWKREGLPTPIVIAANKPVKVRHVFPRARRVDRAR